MTSQMKSILASHYFSIFLLCVVYTVGFAGFSQLFYFPNFELLTPFNLLFSLAVVFWRHQNHNKASRFFFFAIFLAGYIVELIGVKTQLIFGAYWYGKTLGFKILDIPLMIGINWVLLVYICACVAYIIPAHRFIRAFLAAILMVLLDYLIEPFAIQYDLWQWQNNTIPIQNYIAWFVVGFIMQIAFFYTSIHKSNATAFALYFIQLLFFGILLCL